MSIRKRFDSLSPFRKKICIWSLAGAFVLLVIIIGYNTTRSNRGEQRDTSERAREITLEPELIQRTLLREQRQEIESIQQQLAALEKERNLLSGKSPSDGDDNSGDSMPDIPSADQVAQQAETRYPPSPYSGFRNAGVPPPPVGQTPPPPREEVLIGSIGRLSNKDIPDTSTPPSGIG